MSLSSTYKAMRCAPVSMQTPWNICSFFREWHMFWALEFIETIFVESHSLLGLLAALQVPRPSTGVSEGLRRTLSGIGKRRRWARGSQTKTKNSSENGEAKAKDETKAKIVLRIGNLLAHNPGSSQGFCSIARCSTFSNWLQKGEAC